MLPYQTSITSAVYSCARKPSPLGLSAFPAHLCFCRKIWVTVDKAADSVIPCSVISMVTFHMKGKANVAPVLDAPLSVTVTNRFWPLSRAVKAAAKMHMVDAGLSWEPQRPLALHARESSSAKLQDLFQRDYTTLLYR